MIIGAIIALALVASLAAVATSADEAPARSEAMTFAPDVVEHSDAFKARQRKGMAMTRLIRFAGDSLTTSEYWKKLGPIPDADVVGQGWKGQRVAYITGQLAPLLADGLTTDVVLLAGVNDIAGGRSAAAINADLAAAWDVVHSAGARIIQVLPTPWFGYTGGRAGVGKQLFFNDPTTASKLRAVTEGVRQYIRDSVGQPGGPDDIVETATLGDAQGRLLKKYSWDDLHMNGAGYQALGQLVRPPLIGAAAVAGVAIIDLTGVGAGDDDATAKGLTGYGDDDEAALRAELALVNPVNQPPALDADADDVAAGADVPPWPPTWRRPAAGVLAAAAAAALAFLVPLKILLGVIFKESGFNAKLKGYKNALSSPTFAKSYAKYKDLVIPGKNPRKLKWGQVFGPEDWTAYGLCMTLPFCIYGITVPVGAPISALYDVIPNIRAGAKSLAYWYQQTGGDSWDKALKRYNGSSVYVHQVADNVAELEKAGAVG